MIASLFVEGLFCLGVLLIVAAGPIALGFSLAGILVVLGIACFLLAGVEYWATLKASER